MLQNRQLALFLRRRCELMGIPWIPVLTLCCGGMLERGHKDVKETAIRIAKVCGATIVGYALVILLMYVEGESLFGDKVE